MTHADHDAHAALLATAEAARTAGCSGDGHDDPPRGRGPLRRGDALPAADYYIGLGSVAALCAGFALLLLTLVAAFDLLVHLALGCTVTGMAGLVWLVLRSPRNDR